MLRDALRSLFRRSFTIPWDASPEERGPIPERVRGRILYDIDACIGCLLCTKTCPSGAILMKENKKAKFNMDHCLFCGQCRDICPTEAIKFSSDHLIVAYDREDLCVE